MKHKEIKSFSEFPSRLKTLIFGHWLFVVLMYIFLMDLEPRLQIVYLIISALLLWLSIGLVTLKDTYRRWDKRIFGTLGVLGALGLVINLITLGPIIHDIGFILLMFISLNVVYYLSSEEIMDIYYHPTKKNKIIAYRQS